jgi:hypothetical protein
MIKKNTTFSLRKLELAMPILKLVEQSDPTAFAKLLSIILADETTLKLSATNPDAMQPYMDEAYSLDPMEAAEKIAFFIQNSQKFSLVLSGLPIEKLKELEVKQKEKVSVSAEELPK